MSKKNASPMPVNITRPKPPPGPLPLPGVREQARQAGKQHYFTGKPCKYGHISERFVSNGGCCQCMWKRRGKSDGLRNLTVRAHREDHNLIRRYAATLVATRRLGGRSD